MPFLNFDTETRRVLCPTNAIAFLSSHMGVHHVWHGGAGGPGERDLIAQVVPSGQEPAEIATSSSLNARPVRSGGYRFVSHACRVWGVLINRGRRLIRQKGSNSQDSWVRSVRLFQLT
ncbi:hypothetical protein GCM10020219_103820 [Nonomuraea dietziae]